MYFQNISVNHRLPKLKIFGVRDSLCIENCMGKSHIMKKMCNFKTISFEIKFSYLKCVAYLSLVQILKSSRRRLVKLFETATLPSKRMERQTTPSIAGQTSLHKSLSPQKEKSRIAIKTTVP